jgi:hypothetical protein
LILPLSFPDNPLCPKEYVRPPLDLRTTMARKMVTRADHLLTFTFGDFQLDCRARELRKRGRKLRVQQQPIQILARLVAAAGDIVTREELRGAVWAPDTHVDFERGINKATSRLRQVLGEVPQRPRFIETVPHDRTGSSVRGGIGGSGHHLRVHVGGGRRGSTWRRTRESDSLFGSRLRTLTSRELHARRRGTDLPQRSERTRAPRAVTRVLARNPTPDVVRLD